MQKDIQKWKLSDLKPHPQQAQFFDDLPFHLIRDLAQDMESRGQKDPLEILPDGTIVCGHQRTQAAKFLKWDVIDVWVNHELATQGDQAVLQRLIEDNLARRNLDRLDQARCYKQLVEMAPQTPDRLRRSHQMGRLRDVIGQRLGMSGRTLDRYIRVLDAPREVQDAFRNGNVSLVHASKVAGLPNEVQQQLAADLRSGTDPKQAVAARLEGRKPDQVDAAIGTFIRSLERNVGAMESNIGNVRSLSKYDISILERSKSLIEKILHQVRKEPKAAKEKVLRTNPCGTKHSQPSI
jgi:ParB-like chromosome segregation protein Spo0J